MVRLKSRKIFILLNIAFIVLSILKFTNNMDNIVSLVLLSIITLVNIYIFPYLEIKRMKWIHKAIIFMVSIFSIVFILTLTNASNFSGYIDRVLFFICVIIPNIICSTKTK